VCGAEEDANSALALHLFSGCHLKIVSPPRKPARPRDARCGTDLSDTHLSIALWIRIDGLQI